MRPFQTPKQFDHRASLHHKQPLPLATTQPWHCLPSPKIKRLSYLHLRPTMQPDEQDFKQLRKIKIGKKSKTKHPAQAMLGYKSVAGQRMQQGLPRWGEYHKTITFALGKAFKNIALATAPLAHLWDRLTWLDTCWSLKNYSVNSVKKKRKEKKTVALLMFHNSSRNY